MVSFEIYMMRDNMREVSEIGYIIYRMSINIVGNDETSHRRGSAIGRLGGEGRDGRQGVGRDGGGVPDPPTGGIVPGRVTVGVGAMDLFVPASTTTTTHATRTEDRTTTIWEAFMMICIMNV
jgi:hypothetical protein